MYKILIDTSTRYEKSVKLVEIADSKEEIIDEVVGDLDIAAEIYLMLKKHKLAPSDIDEYTPNLGPGSFTGLKIGVTVSNVLNWALNKKAATDLEMPNYGSEPNIDKNVFKK